MLNSWMTTYLGKSCSFGLPQVAFVNCGQFMYLVISPFGFEGRMWDLIVSDPDYCLSFYFDGNFNGKELCSWLSTCVVFVIILMATLPGKSCSPGSPHVWCLRLSWWQFYRERAVFLALHMCGVWGYLNGNFTGKELFSWLSFPVKLPSR